MPISGFLNLPAREDGPGRLLTDHRQMQAAGTKPARIQCSDSKCVNLDQQQTDEENEYVRIIEIVGLSFIILVVLAIVCFIYSLWRKFRQETQR